MHVAARVAIAAAAGGLATVGMQALDRSGERAMADKHRRIDDQVAPARAEWQAWKGALDREFPGMRLETPADHARMVRFMQENPPPSWISVQHEEFTRIRLEATDAFLKTDRHPPVDQGNAYGIGFGGAFALGGAAVAGMALLRGGSSTLMTVGKLAGGAAAIPFGILSVRAGVEGFRTPAPQKPAWDLVREVNQFR
jgi:hypothetical protein